MSFECSVYFLVGVCTFPVFCSRKPSSYPWPEFLPGSLLRACWPPHFPPASFLFSSHCSLCVRVSVHTVLFPFFLLRVEFTLSRVLSLYITVLYSFSCFTSFPFLGCCLKQFLSTSLFSLTLPFLIPPHSIFIFT